MKSLHEVIGWFNCANLVCQAALGPDHVVLLTTTHMRRFCSVPCIAAGELAWTDFVYWGADSDVPSYNNSEALREFIAEHPAWRQPGA